MTGADNRVEPQRRTAYDLLRLISICGVVAIHTFGPIAANQEIRGSASWVSALLLSGGFIWAVPVFVMLAGALSLNERAHRGGPRVFYARRARRIVPALIFWHVIYLVVIRMLVLHENLAPTTVVVELLDAQVYPHLYFLWLIAGLYLAAPVLASFLSQGGPRRAVITASVALGLTAIVFMAPGVLALKDVSRPIQLGALTMWIAYLGYFLAGYALSTVRIRRAGVALAAVGIVVFGGLTLAEAAWPERLAVVRAVAAPEYLGIGVMILAVCVLVVGAGLFDRIRFGPRLTSMITTLSEASFGVFLVHMIVLLIPYEVLGGYHARTSALEGCAAYLFVLVVSFAISIAARRIPGLRLVF